MKKATEPEIRKRTAGERRAYAEGARAVLALVRTHGIDRADEALQYAMKAAYEKN